MIAVTDGPLSPLASFTDHWCQVTIPAVGPFDSSVPVVAAAELLVAQVSRDLKASARDRIDRMRVNFERSMRRMLAILGVLLVYLVVVAPEVLEPYRTPAGQAWMIVPIAIWAGSLLWLRQLSRYERASRFVARERMSEATS